MLDTYSKIIAMSFQGKDFTPAMKQLVINLKLHFDEERKHSKSLFEKSQAASRLSIKRVIATYTNVSLVLGNSS